MESVISLASYYLGGSGERRGTRGESYQTDQLKTSALASGRSTPLPINGSVLGLTKTN